MGGYLVLASTLLFLSFVEPLPSSGFVSSSSSSLSVSSSSSSSSSSGPFRHVWHRLVVPVHEDVELRCPVPPATPTLPWIRETGHGSTVSRMMTECRRVESTGPPVRPFAYSLAPLTHSLAPPCLLRLHALLRFFVRSLGHSLTHSRALGKVNELIYKRSQNDLVLSPIG